MTVPVEQRALKIIAAFEAAGKIVRSVQIEGKKINVDFAERPAPKQDAPSADLIDWRRKK